jgi:hypothetical protein
MSNFKRILFFAKFTSRQKDELGLDIFETNCYSCITRAGDGRVNEIIRRVQAAGVFCKFIIMDEGDFAGGSGIIAKDVIVGGEE